MEVTDSEISCSENVRMVPMECHYVGPRGIRIATSTPARRIEGGGPPSLTNLASQHRSRRLIELYSSYLIKKKKKKK